MASKIDADLCTCCGSCIADCPEKAISEDSNGYSTVDPTKCTECNGDSPKCIEACPVDDCITVG